MRNRHATQDTTQSYSSSNTVQMKSKSEERGTMENVDAMGEWVRQKSVVVFLVGENMKEDSEDFNEKEKAQTWKGFFFTTTGKFPISSLTFPLLCCRRRSIRRAAKGEFSSFHQVFLFHYYHTFFNFSDSLAYSLLFSFALSLCLVFQLSCDSNQSSLLVVPGSINFPVRAFARWFATTTMQLSTMYHLQNSSWNYFVGKELFRSFHRFARLSRSSDCWTWCDLNFSWWNSD